MYSRLYSQPRTRLRSGVAGRDVRKIVPDPIGAGPVNYLNLDSLFMDAAPFAGAETVDVGTWIRLLRYCAKTENGGRIPLETLRDPPSACETPVENPANPVENPANPVENSPPPVELLLKTGRLERILGITADQFNRFAPGLWEIEGDEIVVLGYPVDQEEKVRAN